MGNKGTKTEEKLKTKDLTFLVKQSGLSKDEIENVYALFVEDNPEKKLDKQKFTVLYAKLRPEPEMKKISENIFDAFDRDKNGSVDFHEFLIGYALTSRGDVKTKLEYAFDLYDENNDGILDRNEIKNVIYIMLDVLASDQSYYRKIAKESILQMDTNKDKKITKEEFVDALSTNYALRMLMSPFN